MTPDSKPQIIDKEKADVELTQFEQIVGKDPKMQVIYRLIEDVAVTDTTIMIQGESGTGKELVARAIHKTSPRRDKPFVVINCSAYPETLLESELFGYEKGAFTGAIKTWAGRFEQAHGGTVFLDEIGDISPQAQVKLLRVLQTQQFKRIGGDEIISVDIRVITASNKNLKEQVQAKEFRADLFYRLNVIPIYLPALRNKTGDIPLLARHFLKIYTQKLKKTLSDFSPGAMQELMSYSWPGNTRELQHCIEYAATLAKGYQIEAGDFPLTDSGIPTQTEPDMDETLLTNEKKHILSILETSNWNKKAAAERLGISRSTLYDKINRYALNKMNQKPRNINFD
jgi:transcriptional regulator with PAS, ATPase and Fis domain